MGSRFKLSGQKKALLEKLLKEKGIGAAVAEGIPRRQPSDKAVLSFSQQRLWFLEQLNPGTSFYSLPNFLELQGTIDVPLLERCLNEIVQRHEILRTTFKTTQDQPIQQINDYQLLLFQIDRTGLSDQERIAAIKEFVQQETRHQFDLEKGPLFKATLLRFSDSDHVFCLNAHHIVFDGWSLNVLIQELTDLYTASDIGTASPLSDLSLQYADFAVWQQKWMQGETLDKQLAYWKNKLAGDLPPLELMVARPRKQHPSYQGATQSLELPILLTQQIRELAKQEGSTLFMVMLTALNVLLYRYSGQKDITVGTPIANRNRTEIEGLIGFFVNTLALRTNLSDQLSFRELLKQVRETTLGAYNHQDLPFDKLIEEIKPERNASYQPLFQVLFAFEQASKVSLEFSGITAKPLSVKSEFARFDLMVYVGESPESFTVFIEYSTDLFDDVTITRLLGHFQTLLTEIVDTPTQLVSKFNLLTPSEQTQLLKSSERFQTSTPDCFSQRFIRQVEKTPDAIAAVVQNEQITYRQLQHRVNQCSHILQTLDLGKDDVLGIYLQPGINLIVGLLGALQTGVTYVLTNPENSVAYTTSILQKQQVAAIITSRNLQSELSEGGFANVICLNSREADIKLDPGGSLVQPVSPEHPAAILDCIGRPVTINHRNINQLLEWLQQTVSLIDSDRVLCTFPFVGNAVIRDILWPLSQGSCVVLGHDYFSESSTSISLRQWMSASQVSVAHLLPSDISKLVSEGISSGLESLRYVLCSGEALHRNTVHKFYQQFNCDLAYFYQPSGVAIPIALQAEKLESEREFYPIGHPTTQGIYVLDSHLQPVPIGIQGDIYFADPEFVLSDKYEEGNSDIVNVTNLSQQSILPNSNALPIPDTSLLRTGDIGRWTSEETLDLCKTQQRHVWYRGGQVALSQIENLLLEMPDIEDCTVMLRQSNVHGQELVAYIVSSGKAVSEDMAEEYSNRLTTELPRIALPTSYISVSRIPLTREGELDESALANLEVIDTELRNQWQKQIQGMSDVDQVAVVLKDNHFNSPHLHLSDILPDWKVVIPSDEATHSDLPTGTQTSDRLDGELSINDGGPLPLETLPVQTLQDVLQRASQQA
ncbi:MAG: condensation domain-containing protein, partial [Cyanobacteria bacterium P01_F01_bin.150]